MASKRFSGLRVAYNRSALTITLRLYHNGCIVEKYRTGVLSYSEFAEMLEWSNYQYYQALRSSFIFHKVK